MSPNRKKYISITVAAIILVVTSYVVYALIKDGTPLVKSQNEFLVEANRLHKLRMCRNGLQHPEKRQIPFDKATLEEWRDTVFSLKGEDE